MRLSVHPITPQKRFVDQTVKFLENGSVLILPTESGYTMGCSALSKKGLHKLYQIKKPAKKYSMALMFRDFSSVSEFARIDNYAFKFMKPLVPGPYTFILPATNLGRKLLDVKRPEMGIRFSNHPFIQVLHESLSGPVITTSAKIQADDIFSIPDEIERAFSSNVDLIIDSGPIPQNPTTIIRLIDQEPEVVREGAGSLPF